MSNNEYIAFNFIHPGNLDDFKILFQKIAAIHNSYSPYKLDDIIEGIPCYVFDFFSVNTRKEDWTLPNIISFLLDDLDVEYMDSYQTEDQSGKLEYAAIAYPYGGPEGLIFLLRSFGLISYEVNDGAGLYNIKWTSGTVFTLTEKRNS